MVVIWLNINHSMGYGYHSFGLGYAKILRNGLSIADTVFAYNVWRNCLQELHFSWPVTIFLYHVSQYMVSRKYPT